MFKRSFCFGRLFFGRRCCSFHIKFNIIFIDNQKAICYNCLNYYGAVCTMVILGIDPGYAIVGWGVIEYKANKFRVIDYGAVTTQAKTPFPLRLCDIYNGITEIIKKHEPQYPSMEKLFYNNNAKTVIDVAQARGVITLAAQQNGLKIAEYTPLQVKQSVTGYGRAVKKQVQEMTRIILNLEKIPKPDDTADALAMAICHAHCSGSLLGELSQDIG